MITREELLQQWHTRNNTITVDKVTLTEQEVYFTATVLGEVETCNLDALTDRDILERCRAGFRGHVAPGVVANSLLILQDTFSNMR